MFEASLEDYRRLLLLELVHHGPVSPEQAAMWGAPAAAGRRQALLSGKGGRAFWLRLVEQEEMTGYRPLSTHGWAAFELSVRDAFALHARIASEGMGAFRVLGAPRLVPGFDNFIPFQVAGRAGEVLYLNTVLRSEMAGLDLPLAEAEVDAMFIAVLAASDRAATVDYHVRVLGFEEGETYEIPYSMINESFGLPPDTQTAMTMTRRGRTPASEIDQYPAAARPRPRPPGGLPPGNAIVSFGVPSLDPLSGILVSPPKRFFHPPYLNRRAALVVGPAGEWIELVETGG